VKKTFTESKLLLPVRPEFEPTVSVRHRQVTATRRKTLPYTRCVLLAYDKRTLICQLVDFLLSSFCDVLILRVYYTVCTFVYLGNCNRKKHKHTISEPEIETLQSSFRVCENSLSFMFTTLKTLWTGVVPPVSQSRLKP